MLFAGLFNLFIRRMKFISNIILTGEFIREYFLLVNTRWHVNNCNLIRDISKYIYGTLNAAFALEI